MYSRSIFSPIVTLHDYFKAEFIPVSNLFSCIIWLYFFPINLHYKKGQNTLISLVNVGSMLTDFEKFPPPQKKDPLSTFIDSLDFFHPPLLVYQSYALVFSTKSHLPHLFQPPRLVIRPILHPLQVYSKLHVYQRDESRILPYRIVCPALI